MVKKKQVAFADDILGDMAQHVTREVCATFSLPADQVAQLIKRIEDERRHEWSGARARICYVAHRGSEVQSDRNDRIVRDYLYGERVQLLSRRYGLSERRIWQIIRSSGIKCGVNDG